MMDLFPNTLNSSQTYQILSHNIHTESDLHWFLSDGLFRSKLNQYVMLSKHTLKGIYIFTLRICQLNKVFYYIFVNVVLNLLLNFFLQHLPIRYEISYSLSGRDLIYQGLNHKTTFMLPAGDASHNHTGQYCLCVSPHDFTGQYCSCVSPHDFTGQYCMCIAP